MIEALGEIQPRQVAVLTPYVEALTQSVARCVEESGFPVVAAKGMGLVDNGEIGDVEPDRIVEFAESCLENIDADCVFLSCTNWRAIDARERLAAQLAVPVLSSNQVSLDSVRRATATVRGAIRR